MLGLSLTVRLLSRLFLNLKLISRCILPPRRANQMLSHHIPNHFYIRQNMKEAFAFFHK